MFALYDRFNVVIPHPNDIPLSDEEYDIIEKQFTPHVADSEAKVKKLLEARGRISFIEGTPRPNELVRAIEKRNYVSVYYRHKNGKKGHRLIEPYAIGKGFVAPDGRVFNLDKYYVRGFVIMNSEKDKTVKGRFAKTKSVSVSDKENRWRLFRLDRMMSFTNMDKSFSSFRRMYNPNDRGIAVLIKSLPYSAFPKGENPRIKWKQ